MSVKHIGLVLDHFKAQPALKLVALILADHADSDGLCWPSYRKIAERACLSERSVRRHVKELQDLQIVTKIRTGTIVKREGSTLRISNAYRLNAHVISKTRPAHETKLSTRPLGISDSDDHLEVATSVTDRWTPATTKPSRNRKVNHNACGNVENSKDREPAKLDIDAFLASMIGSDA